MKERKKYVIANWKMNTNLADAMVLGGLIKKGIEDLEGVEIVICPPSTWLYPLKEQYRHKPDSLELGAQNMYCKDQGTFTGEISSLMLKDLCRYVIIGHSERRYIFGEDDELINDKLMAALDNGLIPILCIGEREESKSDELDKSILDQMKVALEHIKKEDINKILFTYEPVWAISTGDSKSKKNASPEYVSNVISLIREEIRKSYGDEIAEETSILYGGSVNKYNINDYAHLKDIDGVLVGAASLKADDFLEICRIIAEK